MDFHVINHAIHKHIDVGLQQATKEDPSEEQLQHSKEAHSQVVRFLKDTIFKLDASLAAAAVPSTGLAASKSSTMHTLQSSITDQVSESMLALNSSSGSSEAIDQIKSMTSGSTITNQATQLSNMTKNVSPILTNLDAIIALSGIDKFDASMNTVPVVGLKDRNIMYVNTKAVEAPDKTVGVQDSWAIFSRIPDVATPSSGTVRFFPYLGDFCMAVGKSVWTKKQIRDQDHDSLSKSMNDWSKLYESTWNPNGDSCLPTSDLKDVVPFATVNQDRSTSKWYLIVLTANSELKYCEQHGDIKDNMAFTALNYSKTDKNPEMPPVWQRAAYFNGQLVAYDSSGTLRTLNVDFEKKTYSIADSSTESLSMGTELTASDIGPVVQRGDGKLYRRIVQIASSGATSKWEPWISVDGVKYLGVASPGVRLDLKLMTRILRARYVSTQTAVRPIAQQLQTFAKVHKAWVAQITSKAAEYKAATSENQKNIAKGVGSSSVAYLEAMGNVIRNVSDSAQAKEAVNLMSDQIKGVKNQLTNQIANLRVKLSQITTRLEAEEAELTRLKVGFWISLVATIALFIGIAVIIFAAPAAAPLLKQLGPLFIAALAFTIYFGVKMTEQQNIVNATKRDIDSVNTAISTLSTIVSKFDDLQTSYSGINLFWGNVVTSAQSVKSMDEMAMLLVGQGLLGTDNNPNLVAVTTATDALETSATEYLSVLDAQGIRIPVPSAQLSLLSLRSLNAILDTDQVDATRTTNASSELINDIELATSADFDDFTDEADVARLSVVDQIQPQILEKLHEATAALEGGQEDVFLDKIQTAQKISHQMLLSLEPTAAKGDL